MQRGSLKQTKDQRGINVWRAQWRENGRGRTRILGRVRDMSRSESRARLDDILESIQGNQGPRPSSTTLGRFVEDKYLISRARLWKTSTRLTTEQIIRTHILAAFPDRLVCSVTREELEALLDAKTKKGLSGSVVRHIQWQLRAIFRLAWADGLVKSNPAAGLKASRGQTRVDKTTISEEDLLRGQMVLDDRERLVYRLAGFDGMRAGEILGLQLDDISDGVTHIQRRVYRGIIDTPKTPMSVRKVPLSPDTLELLIRYSERLEHVGPIRWLFPSENPEKPISYSNLYRRRIQPRLKEIGLAHLNALILRRTWSSLFALAEPDSKLRACLAGHSVDVSENEYRQPPMASLKRAVKRLAKRLK